MDDVGELRSGRRGYVGVVTFNRPERRNALTPVMLIESLRTVPEMTVVIMAMIANSYENTVTDANDD